MKNPHKYTENQILKMNYQAYIKSPNCHNIVENSLNYQSFQLIIQKNVLNY